MSASVGQSEGRSLADQSLNVQCFPSDKCTSSAAMLEAIPGQLCFDCTTTMKATLSYRNTIGSTIETAAGFRGERTTSGTTMPTVMRAIAPRHAIKGPINCSVSPPRRMWDHGRRRDPPNSESPQRNGLTIGSCSTCPAVFHGSGAHVTRRIWPREESGGT